MSVRSDLVGARWSSAVRCIARAEYQGIGIKGDPEADAYLRQFFDRGVNAAENWIEDQERRALKLGKQIHREVPVPWGPNGMWTGHADAVLEPDHLVMEAYHAVGCEYRDEKALQVTQYARKLGPEYTAMLVALDTTELHEDGGFAFQPYAVDVEALSPRCQEIEDRIIAAWTEDAVNPDDRVGESPYDSECRHCPFREACWWDWSPPSIEESAELAARIDALVQARAHRDALKATYEDAADLVRGLQDELRPAVGNGQTVVAGGISVRRVETAPRKGFKFSDYVRAGHLVTPTMRDFATEASEPGERWYVKRLEP